MMKNKLKNKIIDWELKFKKAEKLAIKYHNKQKYGNFSYHYHLQKVVNILIKFGLTLKNETAPILVAGWLHDILEDTELQYDDIVNDFGNEIADIVWCVTDEEGENRKERKQKTYIKLKKNEKAIILKLADRIANVEESKQNNPQLFQIYYDEYLEFYESLKLPNQNDITIKLWQYLDELFLD